MVNRSWCLALGGPGWRLARCVEKGKCRVGEGKSWEVVDLRMRSWPGNFKRSPSPAGAVKISSTAILLMGIRVTGDQVPE